MDDNIRFEELQNVRAEADQMLAAGIQKGFSQVGSAEQILGNQLSNQIQSLTIKLDNILNAHKILASKLDTIADALGLPQRFDLIEASNGNFGFLNTRTASHFNISRLLPCSGFPVFDGTNPRAWMIKCDNYFELRPSSNDRWKIMFASMHFEGEAFAWYQNTAGGRVGMNWSEFLGLISATFEDTTDAKAFRELEGLRQIGSYSDYVNKFEELIWDIPMCDVDLYEDYFISRFVGGLSDELRGIMSELQPESLYDAMEIGGKWLRVLGVIGQVRKEVTESSDSCFQHHQGGCLQLRE